MEPPSEKSEGNTYGKGWGVGGEGGGGEVEEEEEEEREREREREGGCFAQKSFYMLIALAFYLFIRTSIVTTSDFSFVTIKKMF